VPVLVLVLPRSGGSVGSRGSGSASTASTTTEDPLNRDRTGAGGGGFVGRVTGYPIVNSALRVYEQGKSSSRMVKVCSQFIHFDFDFGRGGSIPAPYIILSS
jgi:hypothetical protein